MLNNLRLVSLASGALSASYFPASALEPANLFVVQKGPLLLKPQMHVTTTVTDNLDFRSEDELSDLIIHASPGFSLQLGDKNLNYAELTYFYDRVQHLDHSEFNANQNRITLENRYQKSRFTLEGKDQFSLLSSPLGGTIRVIGRNVERLVISDLYRLNYELTDRTGVYIEGMHGFTDYEEGEALYDGRTLIGTVGFSYEAFSRSHLFGEIYYGTTTSDRNIDFMAEYPTARFIGGFLGAAGSFTEKLTGRIKAGVESRSYEDSPSGDATPVVEASLDHRLTDRTGVSLGYSRRQQESVQFVRSTYTSQRLSAGITHVFGSDERFRGGVNAAYLMDSYEQTSSFSTNRDDDLFFAGLTINYDMKLWLRFFGSYQFEWMDSTAPSIGDYQANRVTVGMQLGY